MKKWSLRLLCLAAAAAAVFCLWYTRPQSFWQATGMDPENITGASGYALVSTTDAGVTTTQSCFLDALSPGQADYEAMLELLEGTTYRASLQNLLSPSSSHDTDSVTATAAFALGDQLVTLQATAPGTVLVTSFQWEGSRVFSVSPGDLNQTLADFVQQRGTWANS